jgi:predicted HTH transcriptional regulator
MWVPRSYVEVEEAIGSAEETTQLDFKEALGASREIAKDIASMTIDGGVLVYGVEEKDTVATAITPVALSGTPERIQQIANSAVDPLPAIEVEVLKAGPADDTGIVVVVVEASSLAPHMANDRYPARSGTTTRYLSQPEVERLYEQRRGFVAVEETRSPFTGFVTPPGPGPVADRMGRLRLFVEPVVPQLHPWE